MAEPKLVGGDVAVDLVNTVGAREVSQDLPIPEHLPTPDAAVHWAERVGVLQGSEGDEVRRAWAHDGAERLAELRALRESVYAVLHAHLLGADAPEALAVLARFWADAAQRATLVLGGGDPLRYGGEPARRIEDRLAHAAVELLRDPDLGRLKQCPVHEGGCGWLFLDRSRNGSRRWCSMEDCGSEVKARRLTERRRSGRAAG